MQREAGERPSPLLYLLALHTEAAFLENKAHLYMVQEDPKNPLGDSWGRDMRSLCPKRASPIFLTPGSFSFNFLSHFFF